MNSDLISVIVPVYKTEKYLSRCVNSIMSQKHKNIEVILVDDGSPDNSPKLCDDLASKHENIRVIHQKNAGLSAARNTGIDNANGKYIAFVDSDDYIEKNMLGRLYQLAEKHSAQVAMLRYLEVTEKSKPGPLREKEEKVYSGEEVQMAFLELKIDSVCVGLYLKSAIQYIRFPVGKTSEDIPFNFFVFQNIERFVYVPEERYFYFYHTDSISNGKLNPNMLNYLVFRKNIYDFYCAKNNDDLIKKSEALYARAAMGLLVRMAIYGISDELDETVQKKDFIHILCKHKKAFFRSKSVPLTRKLLGFAGLHAYGLLKIIGRMKR